jgi:signal transduction histidine kinase
MSFIKQFISRIPAWAFLLVLMAIFVNIVFMIYKDKNPQIVLSVEYKNGYYTIDVFKYMQPIWPNDKESIKFGDTLVSLNSIPIEKWIANNTPHLKVGDTLVYGILRINKVTRIPTIIGSLVPYAAGFFWTIFIIMQLFSIGNLYLLYKKPKDKAIWIFFIYLQLFIISVNAGHLHFTDPLAMSADFVFQFSTCMLGPMLIHFHLLFPKPSKILTRFKRLPLFFYAIGVLFSIVYFISYSYWVYSTNPYLPAFQMVDRIELEWLTVSFILAMTTAIYQFYTIRDTLSRNQLRIIIIGSFFGLITPMTFALFYNYIGHLFAADFPHLIPVSASIGSLLMITCILIAIFHFRLWDIEIFIRKALLYLGATLVIILSYLLLVYLVDLLTTSETRVTRLIAMAVSVLVFLALRDWLQRNINRIFHRESYDSATVVSDFEDKLAGVYREDELNSGIGKCLDEIFHFKSMAFGLKKNELVYEPAFVIGLNHQPIAEEMEIGQEFDHMLRKSKVFSPGELEKSPSVVDSIHGELVVPLLKEDQPYGFFICGPKLSEKSYSQQDVHVLSLLAKKVTALFHTASLYRKDLDRQLLLERERARISQDMHDDIGAGLTKIAMLTEAGFKTPGQGKEVNERMAKVASSSRDMIARLSVIVWALNPRYDNLDSLISYSRRYFGEYLENFGIQFSIKVPEVIPEAAITPDFRRNVFYALQEAIHNAVKHGAATEIILRALINLNKIEFTVTDNGKGFDPGSENLHGNGLPNMKKRAEEMNGSFEIQSSPGQGTRVRLIFNLDKNTTKG